MPSTAQLLNYSFLPGKPWECERRARLNSIEASKITTLRAKFPTGDVTLNTTGDVTGALPHARRDGAEQRGDGER
jgi:hypothetical protein